MRGDVWTYKDDTLGGETADWLVTAVAGDFVDIKKMTGRDIGYTTTYARQSFQDAAWMLFSRKAENVDAVQVSFPCPRCLNDLPIPADDYMCVKCRDET